jgi:hypothetical protein
MSDRDFTFYAGDLKDAVVRMAREMRYRGTSFSREIRPRIIELCREWGEEVPDMMEEDKKD